MSNNAIASLLTIMLAAAGCALLGWMLADALRTGVIPFRVKPLCREESPIGFRAWACFYGACLLLLFAVGVYAAWRLAVGR